MTAWVIIFIVSLVWGLLHYKAGYYEKINEHNKCFKFLEFMRCAINYFIPLVIAYYFISVRWVYVSQGSNFYIGDFILWVFFLIGVFGWLPYLVKNITEGVNVIFAKVLNK